MNDNERIVVYLSGFFDGEGSVFITATHNAWGTRQHVMGVSVTNTDLRPLILFKEHFGGCIYSQGDRGPRRKPGFAWSASSRLARAPLEAMLPFLIVKREEAEIGLAFLDFMKASKTHGRKPTQETVTAREAFRNKLITIHGRAAHANHVAKEA